MLRYPLVIATIVLPLAACGGGDKPAPKKPTKTVKADKAQPKETEEDREAKRKAAAHEIVAEGSTCLPTSLKGDNTVSLELAAVETAAVICAIDGDESRLLGPIGCWTVDLSTGALAYKEPAPLPSHSLKYKATDRCARGYCLPADAKSTADIVEMSWNTDGSKVALLAGDDVHVFDAASKAHEKSFTIRGDKGAVGPGTAVHFVGDTIFVEAGDASSSAVYGFKADGTPTGAFEAIGGKAGKPVSTFMGSFSVLDKTQVAVSEQGMSTLHVFETDTGKRSKLVRKTPKAACKADELDAFWHGSEVTNAKCKDGLKKNFDTLIGATAVKGKTNFLVILRGERLGELAVMDAKSLAEKKSIKLPWCDGAAKPAAQE